MVYVIIGLMIFFFAVYMLSCLINIIHILCKKWFQPRNTAVLIYPVQKSVVLNNYDRVIDIYPTIIPDAVIISAN